MVFNGGGLGAKSLHTSQLSFKYVTMETQSQMFKKREICHLCIFFFERNYLKRYSDYKINSNLNKIKNG